jgi:hypothetical protein
MPFVLLSLVAKDRNPRWTPSLPESCLTVVFTHLQHCIKHGYQHDQQGGEHGYYHHGNTKVISMVVNMTIIFGIHMFLAWQETCRLTQRSTCGEQDREHCDQHSESYAINMAVHNQHRDTYVINYQHSDAYVISTLWLTKGYTCNTHGHERDD